MRVIVTGANGFLGANIVAACLEAGVAVAAVDLTFDNPAYEQFASENLQLIESNCVDMPGFAADALIHAAFITATPEERDETPEANLRANIEPLLSVMEYARRHGIGRELYVSSAAVHRCRRESVIGESLPQRPLGAYGVAKSLMEQWVETMRSAHGRDCLCVRPGSIYGPYEYRRATRPRLSNVAQMMISAMTRGEIVVDQPAERSEWTYAPDIGRALVALLKADSLNYALYQVASGDVISNLELAQRIASLMDGVLVRIAELEAQPVARSSRSRILEASRLAQDVGFSDWTKMSELTLRRTLEGISLRAADA
ncbi:MAG: NAD(P)-dependent oxidoreductase [Chloroflexi bacterium]|nr:NAD(P)-dependent oxidoreductase [Chloroflexota bacterium]